MTIINPTFSGLNFKRAKEIFKVSDKGPEYFALSLAEEVGEVCGALKKLQRGFNPREESKQRAKYEKYMFENSEAGDCLTPEEFWLARAKSNVAKELADVLIYLDLMASHSGIDLDEAVVSKFNSVSEEMKTDIKL